MLGLASDMRFLNQLKGATRKEGEMTSRLLDLCRLGPCLAVVAAIVLLCGSSVLAPAQGDPLPKIGYLGFGAATPPTFFQNRMRELGYSEGKDVEVEYRFADGRPEKLPVLARELVDAKVNVIGLSVTRRSWPRRTRRARFRSPWWPAMRSRPVSWRASPVQAAI